VLYDNIGILAVPPRSAPTKDVDLTKQTPGFLAGGGLPGGGTGSRFLQATARRQYVELDPTAGQWPYSINWNLGVQHSFGKDFTAEIRYVGTPACTCRSKQNYRRSLGLRRLSATFLQQPSHLSWTL